MSSFFFFFQAEDGIRDHCVTGVQTCALPICEARRRARVERLLRRLPDLGPRERELVESMSRQLVTDLLHEPVSELRADPDGSRREAAFRLFRLDPPPNEERGGRGVRGEGHQL